jgi:DNA-binding transcriptional LysR family regulator
MHINDIDLNLLRVFDAVYRTRSVSQAAELLGLTQPTASQALMRLRLLVKDPLFIRASRGVAPTPKADKLADAVQRALGTLEEAFNDSTTFIPKESRRTFRMYMSDVGEARFMPGLMVALRQLAPGVRIETFPRSGTVDITSALDSGRVDFAFGYLPALKDTQRMQLLKDGYVVLLREGHPLARKSRRRDHSGAKLLEELRELEFVAVRTHSESLRILQQLRLEDRVRLITEHFMVLPAIVKATDFGVVTPRNIARTFVEGGGNAIIEIPIRSRNFIVSLHWSKRFESDAGNSWMRQTLMDLFLER